MHHPTNDTTPEDEVEKKPSAVATTLHGEEGGTRGTRARTGLWGSFKNHTFFIFGWCAAEMRRIIDVSCLPGAGSYNASISALIRSTIVSSHKTPAVSCLHSASLISTGSEECGRAVTFE